MPLPLKDTKLFEPITVGPVTLKNRIACPPLTRMRNSEDHVPTEDVIEHYRQRAANNGGLIVVEATSPDETFGLFPAIPMIKTTEQVQGFKKLVDAIHKEDTAAALQLWGLGKVAADENSNHDFAGAEPVEDGEEKKDNDEWTIAEIEEMVKEYGRAAKRAIDEAGFDIVEIHAAGLFLIDQFFQESYNKRTDKYGGSIENRSRFYFEVIDECIKAVGAERIGTRFSPYGEGKGEEGVNARINPIVSCGYLLSELERRAKNGDRLAYVSLVEPRVDGVDDKPEKASVDFSWPQLLWKGVLFRSGGFLHEPYVNNLIEVVNASENTIFGFGRYFTSNPDLVERLKNGYELTPYHRDTFYFSPDGSGYNDFSNYSAKDEKKSVEEDKKTETVETTTVEVAA